jgi:hypothetical protein
MKKITFVSGSNSYIRTSFIKQKGFMPIHFNASFEGAKLNMLLLSVEDELNKSNEVFIELCFLTKESIEYFKKMANKFNVHTSSIYLIGQNNNLDFIENEREFSLFLKLPHNKIYFDFFSTN